MWVRSRYANKAPEFQSRIGVQRERADVYGNDDVECGLSRGYTVSYRKGKRKDKKDVTMKQ